MNPYWVILILILAALALPARAADQSWARFFVAMVMAFVVVVLPLFVFFLSSFMVPEWKGACAHGWLDCFIIGKLGFTPFVLLATAALYKKEVLRSNISTNRWAIIGVYLGAIVATTCLVFGLVCLKWQAWMLVPLYVAIWYVIRAGQFIWSAKVGFWTYFWATLGTVPSWLYGYFWSRQVYESLPDTAPSGCFIVTAAGRGHEKYVGPFIETTHRGQRFKANQQLITLWQFENCWQRRFPRGHALFRRIYNHVGPVIATQIRSPWLADLVWLALKPVEIVAEKIIRLKS